MRMADDQRHLWDTLLKIESSGGISKNCIRKCNLLSSHYQMLVFATLLFFKEDMLNDLVGIGMLALYAVAKVAYSAGYERAESDHEQPEEVGRDAGDSEN